jgi:hypothetical protein
MPLPPDVLQLLADVEARLPAGDTKLAALRSRLNQLLDGAAAAAPRDLDGDVGTVQATVEVGPLPTLLTPHPSPFPFGFAQPDTS